MDRKGSGAKRLYGVPSDKLKIFSDELERDLAKPMKELSEIIHSLTSQKCRKLAYDIWISFAKQHCYSLFLDS